MVGGVFTIAVRAPEVVSPVRTATVMGGTANPSSRRDLGDLGQRALEVLMDVDGEGLQRRDVHHAHRPPDVLAAFGGTIGGVDRHQESGQGLARTGRGRDEGVGAPRDEGPSLGLGLGRTGGEPPGEPGGDGGVKAGQRRGGTRVGGRVHGEHHDHSIISV